MNVKLLLPLAFVTVFSSCGKDDPAPSNTELLTSKTWKQTYLKTAGLTQDLDPCELDDRTTFSTDGIHLLDEGATKCDPSDPQTISGTWSFQDDETTLRLSGDGVSSDFQILMLSNGTLRLKLEGLNIEVGYQAVN